MARTDVAPIAEEFVQRLLHRSDPGEAISTLSQRWSVRARGDGPWGGLSKPERDVELVLVYAGEVRNGGHTQFFLNRGGRLVSPVRSALLDVSLVELVATLDEAVALFPRSVVLLDETEVEDVLASWEERDPAEEILRLASLDRRVWALDVYPRLLAHLRKHERDVLRSERGLED